uniref:rRNA methyltransferase 2, mitochondrial n=1 Tax=Salmo trutta TaxID=8032 RepID=A0A673XMH0_SALTR
MWYSVLQKSHLHTSVHLLKKAAHNLKGNGTAAHVHNYRCRSAFKLLEIDDKYKLLKPGFNVIDCGAAPGAWSQIAVHRVNSTGASEYNPTCGTVVGIDLLHIAPLDGAHFLSNHDITDPVTLAKLLELLPGAQPHVIMSDMAPNASGFKEMNHEKVITMSLIDLAEKVLQTGGSLICKYWDGALAHQLQQKLSAVFRDVRTVNPKASRKLFFLARSYRKNKIVWLYIFMHVVSFVHLQ